MSEPVFTAKDGAVYRRGVFMTRESAEGVLRLFEADARNTTDWFHRPAAKLARELAAALEVTKEAPCTSPQPLRSDGPGGKPPSQDVTRPSTKTTHRPASTPFASSPTGSGSKAPTSPPASGGSPARSTPKPKSCCPTSAAAPRSTASL